MNKAPAFQFYAGDYLSSSRVTLLTLEEEGAYIRLLCHCWLHGSIPNDPEMIARLIGKGCSTTLASKVANMFTQRGEVLVSEKMEGVRQARQEWIEKCKKGGRASAEKRKSLKNNENDAKGTTKGSSKGSSTGVVDVYLEVDGNTSSSSSSSVNHSPSCDVPSLEQVQEYAQMIGLAPWKAEDWWLDMESKGWRLNNSDITNWQAGLSRIKQFWEADGRPMERPGRNAKPADNGKPQMPLWKRIEVLRQTLDTHPGNIDSVYYKQGCKQSREEYKAHKQKLAALLKEEKMAAVS